MTEHAFLARRLRADLRPDPRRTSRAALVGRLALSLSLLLGACGGGGGGGAPPAPLVIDGLAGTVRLPDFDLGRIIEQEPNDTRAAAFRLPPVWARSVLEVTGDLGVTAERFAHVDAVDVLLYTCLADQTVSLELTFQGDDPTQLGHANDVRAEVFRRTTGVSVAQMGGGGQPRSLVFDALGGESYEIVLTTDGHGWWTARFTTDDPVGGALLLTSKPAAPAMDAPRAFRQDVRPLAADRRCAFTHVLVRLRDGCEEAGVCDRQALRAGRRTAAGSHRMLFETPRGVDPEARAVEVCARLRTDPDVLWAEPDYVVRSLGVPTDPEFGRQWNMRAVGAPSAWDVTTGDASITVAVVDSGIGAAPDLAGRIVPGYDFVSDPAIAGDGDGRDDDPTDMGDAFLASGLSSWHGTHVASIIAANHDGVGMAGLAPKCSVMMLRALGVGGGFVSDAADAILYAAGVYTTADGRRLSGPLPVVNLSIGLDQDSAELRDACFVADGEGCLLVAAVGNGGGAVQYPAAYPTTLAVAAVDGALATTQYSSFGDAVDLSAPGGGASLDVGNDGWPDGVLSAVKDETVEPSAWSHVHYVGTSQAAPHVAGAAALLLSIDPTLSVSDLKLILRGTALDLGPAGEDVAYGTGLLQVHEAVKFVRKRIGQERGDAPYLLLPIPTVQFEGLRTSFRMPLFNGGGGVLNVFFATGETDDGVAWLSASLQDSTLPAPPIDKKTVTINVDRSLLPTTTGQYSGTVFLGNGTGILGTVRVVLYVKARTRAGEPLPAVVVEDGTGIARRKAYAMPEFGYRYWFRGLPAADYRIQAGEDLDADGFFCEIGDACGWHGGATRDDAVVVPYVPGSPAIEGLTVTLRLPP